MKMSLRPKTLIWSNVAAITIVPDIEGFDCIAMLPDLNQSLHTFHIYLRELPALFRHAVHTMSIIFKVLGL